MAFEHALAAGSLSPGRAVSIAEADRFAASVQPLIQNLQRSGIASYRGIARALNNRGIRTARGGQWQVSNVRNLLARAATVVATTLKLTRLRRV